MLNWALASWSSAWIGATIGVLQHGVFHLPNIQLVISWGA